MLDLALFRNPTFSGANVTMLLVSLAMFGIFFFNSLFLQNILGYSPIQTGAIFLPMTLLIIVFAPQAGRLSDRIGSRWLIGTGMLLLTGSLLLFAQLDAESNFWNILPGLVVGGIGMSLTMTPTTAAAMGSVPVDKAGVGSAVLNAFRQVGGSLGIAIMGAVVASQISLPPTSPGYAAEVRRRLPPRAVRRSRDRTVRLRFGCLDRGAGLARRRARRRGGGRMTATTAKTRLAAAERRAALVDAALRVFASGSYGGATTAEIAREAGVSEPILYRHFASKRDLYIACLEETWSRLRAAVEEIVANEPDPSEWPLAFARAKHALQGKRHVPAHIWIQALSVAGTIPRYGATCAGICARRTRTSRSC